MLFQIQITCVCVCVCVFFFFVSFGSNIIQTSKIPLPWGVPLPIHLHFKKKSYLDKNKFKIIHFRVTQKKSRPNGFRITQKN